MPVGFCQFGFPFTGVVVASGWTDDGTTVRLTTITDLVVIGALVPIGTEALRVVGDERIEGTLFLISAGTNNTLAGDEAGVANTTGFNLTAFGNRALESNTTGGSNTAIGVQALRFNTTADNNTAVGSSALVANTTGASNTAVGSSTLAANTTGTSNTAIGASALDIATTASSNTAVGTSALGSTTTGGENASIGNNAGNANTTGVQNTFVGAEAGNTGSTGTLTNATAIGYNTQVTQSDTVILGNGADIGIGTSTPTARLNVSGTVTFDAPDTGFRINGQTDGAGASLGTLTNAPSSGNPNFWLPINIAGTVRYFPGW